MILRVVIAQVKRGQYKAYRDICEGTTVPAMSLAHGYIASKICASHARKPNYIVSASLWMSDADILRFVAKDHPTASSWEEVKVLTWEEEAVAKATVMRVDDSYLSLAQMWGALGSFLQRDSGTPPFLALSDSGWRVIEDMVAPPPSEKKPRGRPPRKSEITVRGVFQVVLTGTFWKHAPPGAAAATYWRRMDLWQAKEKWEPMWEAYLLALPEDARIERLLAFLDCHYVTRRRKKAASDASNQVELLLPAAIPSLT